MKNNQNCVYQASFINRGVKPSKSACFVDQREIKIPKRLANGEFPHTLYFTLYMAFKIFEGVHGTAD